MTTYEQYEKDDYNGNWGYAQRIYNDEDIKGKVDFQSDKDYYKIKFPQSGKANFYVNPLSSDLDVDLTIYDKNNNSIDGSSKGTEGEHDLVTIDVTADEYYYIEVRHYSRNTAGVGSEYHLRCKVIPEVKYEVDHIPVGKKRTGRSMNPTTLTIHSTGNANSTARGERGWLTNPDNTSSTGFHIVVDENRAIEVIPFDETAYHAGDGGSGPGNTTSIGLEICEPGDRLKTLENAAYLAAKILNDYGWGTDKLRQHYDWSRKNCPQILRDPTSRGGESYQTWDWFVNKVEQSM